MIQPLTAAAVAKKKRVHLTTHHRLTALAVAKKKTPGAYHDGGGLYLQVTPTGSKSWSLRYMLNGRPREMGLGPLHTIDLATAREKARSCRALLLDGIDPLDHHRAQRAAKALEATGAVTFNECAEKYIAAHKDGWSNAKHTGQWTSTLETYAGPVIGKMNVAAVDTALVLKVLEPIWTDKHETATRLRARIENVLDWARVRGYRIGENPARWRGHMDALLPALSKRRSVRHHPALPYVEVSTFMQALRAQTGTAARALEFLILTAARTGEVIGAAPAEFDLKAGVWTIPAERMKTKQEHRVPLSRRAIEIAREGINYGCAQVFPGMNGKPLSNTGMLKLLERMGRSDVTAHGFRSTFRDWAADCTTYPSEVCEMALAHTIGNAAEAAYRRGDLFEKRTRLMADWQRYCETTAPSKKVSPIRARVAA